MRNLSDNFQNRTIQWNKLLEYGFIQKEDCYYLERPIVDGLFQIVMVIGPATQTSKVIDLSTEEEYVLVDVPSSSGNFVGKVKEDYENEIHNVIQNCTTPNVFQEAQSQRIIRYIKEKRIVPYMLLVLLAASFHNSLLLMIPIYFLAQIPVNRVSMGVYAGVTVLVLIFSWQLFDLVTQFVYQYYATEQNLYFMNGRDFMTGFVPVLAMVMIIGFKKLLLKQNPRNVVLVNLAMYAGIFFILTWKHFLFQRIGNIFFTAAILYIPELLAALQSTATEEEKEKRFLAGKGSWRNYGYYYGLAAVMVFGLIYYFWFIQQNRINLLPFYTVFQEIQVSALRVQAITTTILNTLVQTFG